MPADLEDQVGVGRLVRVPLGGRRVRGFVVSLRSGDTAGLKEVIGLSGDSPVFDQPLLETLRWTAVHYVAPLSVVLGKTAPPNLPRYSERRVERDEMAAPDRSPDAPVPETLRAALEGRHTRARYLVGPGPWEDVVVPMVVPVVRAGRSALVVGPTLREVEELARHLAELLPGRVVVGASDRPAREETDAWVRSRSGSGVVVVGTRSTAFWPVGDLALAMVLEEGRRGMKDKQTPTVHVREVLSHRAKVERFGLLYAGRVPTTEALAAGVEIVRAPGRSRAWPLVEVVDRWEEPPGAGILTERVRSAVRLVTQEGGRVFAFTHRRGYASASRCVGCRTLLRCPGCGARPDPGRPCARCGAAIEGCPSCGGERFEPLGAGVGRVVEELRRVVGKDRVAAVGEDEASVLVGTERDLVAVRDLDLTLAVDADGLLMAPNYRAAEDALRVLARLAGTVRSGRGKRAMVQTAQPSHPVMVALRRGDPVPCLQEELEGRTELGFPPAGQVVVLEVRGGPEGLDGELRAMVGDRGSVLGPAPAPSGSRWLIQGADLRGPKIGLRSVVQRIRDHGGRVHVDADPIEL